MLANIDNIKISNTKTLTPVSFRAFNLSKIATNIGKDVVEISQTSTIKANLWQKFQGKLNPVSEGEILAMIKRLSSYPEKDVLAVMGALSGYSNMNILMRLKSELEFNDIRLIEPFMDEYDCGYAKEGKIPNSKHLNINHALGYFYNEGRGCYPKCPLENGVHRAIILDNNTIEYLEELQEKNPEIFREYLDSHSYKMFYLNNFEQGYNIFNQQNSFESLVLDTLEKLKQSKIETPQLSFEELLEDLLNKNYLDRIEKLGIEPKIIDLSKKRNISPKAIATNLSPIMPTYSDFSDLINKALTPEVKIDSSSDINPELNQFCNFINQKLYLLTPQTLCQKLVKLKQLIEDDVRSAGKDVNKIYYNVAKPEKSFALINYMYHKINNTPKEKIYYWENPETRYKIMTGYEVMGRELPEGSTLVILDDAFISGESITQTQFRYEPLRVGKTYDILFASVFATPRAKDLINGFKHKTCNDRIISVDTSDKDVDYKLGAETCIMFPHNAPDNNHFRLKPLLESFYPYPMFVQDPWIE